MANPVLIVHAYVHQAIHEEPASVARGLIVQALKESGFDRIGATDTFVTPDGRYDVSLRYGDENLG